MILPVFRLFLENNTLIGGTYQQKNTQLKNRSLKLKGAVLICRFDIYSCIFVLLTSVSDESVLSGESRVSSETGILRNRVRKDSVL